MKMDITKEEYRNLLDIISIADWVMSGHKTKKDGRTAPYDALIQKVYSLAKDQGFEKLIELDPLRGDYYLTSDFEENSRSWEFIDDFTDDSFWDELAHRMTERDAANLAGGFENLKAMNREERATLEGPILERYDTEFFENGVDRLQIVEPFGLNANRSTMTHD